MNLTHLSHALLRVMSSVLSNIVLVYLTYIECNDAAKHSTHPAPSIPQTFLSLDFQWIEIDVSGLKRAVSSMWHLKLDLILACQKSFVVTRLSM